MCAKKANTQEKPLQNIKTHVLLPCIREIPTPNKKVPEQSTYIHPITRINIDKLNSQILTLDETLSPKKKTTAGCKDIINDRHFGGQNRNGLFKVNSSSLKFSKHTFILHWSYRRRQRILKNRYHYTFLTPDSCFGGLESLPRMKVDPKKVDFHFQNIIWRFLK